MIGSIGALMEFVNLQKLYDWAKIDRYAITTGAYKDAGADYKPLTDAQRECIQLAYYEGLTYVQVSDRLTANLATIKSRMRDAIRGLRNCLGVS